MPKIVTPAVKPTSFHISNFLRGHFASLSPIKPTLLPHGKKAGRTAVLGSVIAPLVWDRDVLPNCGAPFATFPKRMLTQTLRALERDGLITRHVFPTKPPSVEYRLAPLGQSLLDPLVGPGALIEDR